MSPNAPVSCSTPLQSVSGSSAPFPSHGRSRNADQTDTHATPLSSAKARTCAASSMTMNYAESYDGDMGDYALAAARSAHAQLRDVFGLSEAAAWRGMALTPMLGVNDVENET
ncbi:hypothetical protein SUDANB54_02893 [Streptomyces sp. enrichment culture]